MTELERHFNMTINDLFALVYKVQCDNQHDSKQAEILGLAIERHKIERNNEQAMKGLDQHFEYRGGCFDERDRYDS
jgi:hypothetical protein